MFFLLSYSLLSSSSYQVNNYFRLLNAVNPTINTAKAVQVKNS